MSEPQGNDKSDTLRLIGLTLIILLAIAAALVSAGSANPPPPLVQNGQDTQCTIGGFGQSCGSITVTFPIAFTKVPTLTLAFDVNSASPQAIISDGQIIFLATDPAVIFLNMPAATTELFSNTNHRIAINLPGVYTMVFHANCVAGSSSATAILVPQLSQNGGSTWTDLFTGGLNIAAANCPGTLTSGTGTNGFSSGNLLRVAGRNGGGLGDTPSITNAYLELRTSSITGGCMIQITTPPTLTSFTYTVLCPTQFFNTPLTIDWTATG